MFFNSLFSRMEHFEIIAHSMQKMDGIVRRNMFGWDCLFINGNSFLGGKDSRGMLFKLSQKELNAAILLNGITIFDPMGNGKGMSGWIIADPDSHAEWPRLAQQALNVAQQLPPKDKAKKKSKDKVSVKKAAPAKKAAPKKAVAKKGLVKKVASVKKVAVKKKKSGR